MIEYLKSGSAVYTSNIRMRRYMVDECDLHLEKFEDMTIQHAGFAMRKDHPLLTNISEKISQYLADGTIQNIINTYTKKCPVTKHVMNLPKADIG